MSGPAPLWIAAVDPRLDVVLVDALDRDLDARLLAELLGLVLEQRVGGRDEVRPLQQVQPRALRVRRRAAGGDDALEAAGATVPAESARKLRRLTDLLMECLRARLDGGRGGILARAPVGDRVSAACPPHIPRSRRGSSRSRSQSPTRLMPSTTARIARPGNRASHQPVVR